jgi:hypothetical protein
MTICGYHPLMGEGLRTFADGLRTALKDKSSANGNDLRSHLFHEADEIEILTTFMEKHIARENGVSKNGEDLGFLGLIYICRSLMGDGIKFAESSENMDEIIMKRVERLIDFLQTFEDEFSNCSITSSVGKTRAAWAATSGKLAINSSDDGS